MGDLLASMNSRAVFTSITAGGNAVWLSNEVRQYQVTSNGAIRLGTNASGQVYGSAAVGQAMERIVQTTRRPPAGDGSLRGGGTLDAGRIAAAHALKPASDPLFGTAPASGSYNATNDPQAALHRSEQPRHDDRQPAGAADAGGGAHHRGQRQRRRRREAAGVLRQPGRLLTHDAQNNHAQLMARPAHALRYFDDTLGALGLRNRHHLHGERLRPHLHQQRRRHRSRLGCASLHDGRRGARRRPLRQLPGVRREEREKQLRQQPRPARQRRPPLPTTSVDQLGATLGRWFGLSDTQLLDVFPNLANFSTRNLGFLT